MNIFSAHRIVPLAVVLLSAGCQVDNDLPSNPILDATLAITSLDTLHLAGTAEYNAAIAITGGVEAGAATADAHTGRFAADIGLALGENTLDVTATDAAGNQSEAVRVTITRQSPRAETITVSLRDAVIRADDGTLHVAVDVTNSEAGVDLTQVQATLTIPEDATFTALPLTFNRVGHTDLQLDERRTVGAFTVRVEADVADEDGNKTVDDAAFAVTPGHPVNVDFMSIDPVQAPFLAGDPVIVTYAMQDGFGNDATATQPIVVTVNAANVAIVDDGAGTVEIDGLVRAGSYIVRAHLGDSDLEDDTEALVIEPNPELSGFNMQLSSSLIAEFGTVVFSTSDGFGNAIDEATVDTTFSDPTAITRLGAQLTFNRPGAFSVTACLTGTSLCDTEFVSVQGLLDTVAPTLSVRVESPASGSVVARGQRVVFVVTVTDDRALSSLSFVTTFGNNGNCRSTGGPLLFSGTTAETRTFSFSVASCAIPLDGVSIVAQAIDQAGNTRNEADETLSVFDPFNLSFPGSGGGNGSFVTTIAGFNTGSNNSGTTNISGPTGVTVDALSGTVFVANGSQGNRTDRAVGITIDRVQFDVTDQNGQRIDLNNVRSVASARNGSLFFGVDEVNAGGGGSSGIVRVTADLQRQIFVNSTTPGGQQEVIGTQQTVQQLAIDESSSAPAALCMVIESQDHVYCYGTLDATASRLAEIELTNLSPRGIAFDAPDIAGDADVLFVALDEGTHAIRPFTLSADRRTATAGTDISLSPLVNGNFELGDLVVGPPPGEHLYLAHNNDGRVLKIDRSTNPATVSVFVDGLSSPSGLAFDGESLLISDDNDDVVFRIVPDPANPGAF